MQNLEQLAKIAQETLKNSLDEELKIKEKFDTAEVFDQFLTTDVILERFRQVEKQEGLEYLLNRGGKLPASQVASSCLRQVLFQYYGLQELDEDKIATFALVRLHSLVGKLIHQFIQEVLPFHFTELPLYIELRPGLVSSGYIDAVYKVKHQNTIKTVLVEIKTAYDWKLTKKFKGDPKHWLQLKFYAMVLGRMHNLPHLKLSEKHYLQNEHEDTWQRYIDKVYHADFVQLIYIDKQLQVGADYVLAVQQHDPSFSFLQNKIKLLISSIDNLQIPALKSSNFIDKNDCRFCPYESYCHNNPGLISVTNREEFTFKSAKNEEVYIKEGDDGNGSK